MSSLKAAFHSIVKRIKDKSIFKIKPINQDKSKEIRYTRKHEFNEIIVKDYLSKKIDFLSNPYDINSTVLFNRLKRFRLLQS